MKLFPWIPPVENAHDVGSVFGAFTWSFSLAK